MFERLMEQGKKSAEARRVRAIARLAERAGEDLPPGVSVETVEDGVVLFGHGLLRRMLSDVRLRAIGLLAKGESG